MKIRALLTLLCVAILGAGATLAVPPETELVPTGGSEGEQGLDWDLVRALFLPRNLQLTLHVVEIVLLVLLVLDLAFRFVRGRRTRTVLQDGDGRSFDVTRLVFGKEPGAGGVKVEGAPVSRRHLEVRRAAGGRLVARDAGSTNGTFLRRGSGAAEDLRDQEKGVELEPGDVLELGHGGPLFHVATVASQSGWMSWPRCLLWLAFLVCGLHLGRLANLENLPAEGVQAGHVVVDFTPFLSWTPLLTVMLSAALMGFAFFVPWRRGGGSDGTTAGNALVILVTIGLMLLYPLLPAVGLRYARAAERAAATVETRAGPDAWHRLVRWEDAGGRPRSALADLRAGRPVSPPLPDLGLDEAGVAAVVRSYNQGRGNLRWATNLASQDGRTFLASTFFRQALALVVAVLAGIAAPLSLPMLGRAARRIVDKLRRPLSDRLIRRADRGEVLWQLLRPVAYWDMVCGFAAAAVVAITVWTPLGTSLGRGKSLYLDLPGLPTVQSVEVVKALFVLFVAGYFARQGQLLRRVARRRYLVPYVTAALGTLALTGVQADMGGLFMLGLFLALVFVAATGYLRLVLLAPVLLLPGLGIAWFFGMTSIVETRLGIWAAARTHALGEQLVQARQMLLSSGWTGFSPPRHLAWRVPDIQGDLVVAAFGERFGLLGLTALVALWYLLVASLVREARRNTGGISILLSSVAVLVLVQVLTQAGGILGLLPLTGVPVPWLSHGLTASLIFTFLVALALAAGSAEDAVAGTETGTAAVPVSFDSDPLRFVDFANAAAMAALLLLAVVWTEILPLRDDVGARGHRYRWENLTQRQRVEKWIADDLFEPIGSGPRVRLAAAGQELGRADLRTAAEGLRYRVRPGEEPRFEIVPWLVTNPNLFAERPTPRGAVTTCDGVVVAVHGARGRSYPLGASFFHPVGYGGSLASSAGVEGAARSFLGGLHLDRAERLRAFKADLHHGPDLFLTLHSELQATAYEALDGRRGAAVLMDLTDGSLLALASSPGVDPTAAGRDDWLALPRHEDLPLRQRALRSTDGYSPPGSVFKIVVAAAVLDGNEIDPEEELFCPGRDQNLRVSCAHGKSHGRVALDRALTVSCNIYFARMAVRLGAERVRATAELFGFSAAETANLLHGVPGAELRDGPSPVDPASDLRDRDLARTGYGQGPVSATPLQIARMGAVIATGGLLPEPYLAEAIGLVRRESGALPEVIWQRRIAEPRSERVLRQGVADALRLPLAGVFDQVGGTARRLDKLWWSAREGWRLSARSPGDGYERFGVAGKTGSAWKEREDRTDDAWMVAWAPAAAPRLVVSVLVEEAGEGGRVAGPIAVRLLRDGLEALGHRP